GERLSACRVAEQRSHLVTTRQQLQRHVPGDKAGRARDEHLHSAMAAVFALARRRRSATEISKTASGSPAAAHTFSKRDMSSSIRVSHGVSCANGGTPPIAYPVKRLASSAVVRRTAATPVASRRRSSLTRRSPQQSTTSGRSPATNTSDFTISPTLTPISRAASAAVRVLAPKRRISIGTPRSAAYARTRATLGCSATVTSLVPP